MASTPDVGRGGHCAGDVDGSNAAGSPDAASTVSTATATPQPATAHCGRPDCAEVAAEVAARA